MQDPKVLAATASEPLGLDEEFEMQQHWRKDGDKLTFIVCSAVEGEMEIISMARDKRLVKVEVDDAPERMLGDVNLFLTTEPQDGDEGASRKTVEGDCTDGIIVGELELMIAPTARRRQGYGRAAVLAFLWYLTQHLDEILDEYKSSLEHSKSHEIEDAEKVSGSQDVKNEVRSIRQGKEKQRGNRMRLRVKIGSKNEASIRLFEGLGFEKKGEENYFGEVEMWLHHWEAKVKDLLERFEMSREYLREGIYAEAEKGG